MTRNTIVKKRAMRLAPPPARAFWNHDVTSLIASAGPVGRLATALGLMNVVAPARRLPLLIGTLMIAMVMAVLPTVPASAATDYTDGYAICSAPFVDGANGANNKHFVIQFGRTQHPGICAAEQTVIDSTITVRGVPNTTAQRNRIVEFGRGEVGAEILLKLEDIVQRHDAGDVLQPWESDAYAWWQQRVALAKLAAVKQAIVEYQDWGNDPCNYTPPAPYTYDPYTGGTCSGTTELNGIFTGGPNPPTFKNFLTYGVTRYANNQAEKLGYISAHVGANTALLTGLVAAGAGAAYGIGFGILQLSAVQAMVFLQFATATAFPTLGVAAIGPGIAGALIVAGIVRGVQVIEAGAIGKKLNDAETAAQALVDDPSSIDLGAMLKNDDYDSQMALGAFTAALAPYPDPSASEVTAATPDPNVSTPWFKITDGTSTEFTQKISFASVTPTDVNVRANYEAWLDHNWWVVQEVSAADSSTLIRTLTPTLPVFVTGGTQGNVQYVPGSGFAVGIDNGSGADTKYPPGPTFTFKAPPVGGDNTDLSIANVTDVTASLYDRPYLDGLTTSPTSPAEGGTFTVSGTYHDPAGSTGSVKLAVPGASKSVSGLADGDTFSLSVTLPDAGSVTATLSSSNADGHSGVDTTYPLYVSNPAPTDLTLKIVNTANDGYGPEPGIPVEADVTFSDVPTDTTHTYTVQWGDGTTSTGTFDAATPPTHTYTADGVYLPTVTISDEDGASASIIGSVIVNDVPVLTGLPSSVTIDEGQSVSWPVKVVDSSPLGFPTVTYKWTDPEHPDSATAIGGTASTNTSHDVTLTHLFDEEGTFTETFTPIDATGLHGKPVTVTVTVNAVPPTLTTTSLTNTDGSAIGAAGVLVGRAVKLSAAFTEPGADPDVLTVNWGDGTTDTTGEITGRSASFDHTWATDGTKDVVVTVEDDDGGTATRTIPVTVSGLTDVAGTTVQSLTQLQGTTASQIRDVINLLDNGGNGNFVSAIDRDQPKLAATKLRDAIVNLTGLADQGVAVQPEIDSLLDLFGFWASTVVDQAQTDGTASAKQISAALSYLDQAASAAASGDAAGAAQLYRKAVSEVS